MAYNCCLAVIVSFVDAIVCCVCTLDDCDCCPFRLWHLWLMTFRVPYIIWLVDCITVASRHLFDSQSLMAIWRIHSYGLNAFICIYGNASTDKITTATCDFRFYFGRILRCRSKYAILIFGIDRFPLKLFYLCYACARETTILIYFRVTSISYWKRRYLCDRFIKFVLTIRKFSRNGCCCYFPLDLIQRYYGQIFYKSVERLFISSIVICFSRVSYWIWYWAF